MHKLSPIVLLCLLGLLLSAPSPAEGPHRERIEWCDIWFTDAEKEALPRVLLIGDSITRGYFDGVEKALAGKAYCGRLTTSRSVGDPVFFDELALVLKQYPFAVVHVNNGLHGWAYSEKAYRAGMARLLDVLQRDAPQAKLIVATTTPVRPDVEGGDKPARILARNEIVAKLCAERGLMVNDLHGAMLPKPEWLSGDGVHFGEAGRLAQAKQVAMVVGEALTKER